MEFCKDCRYWIQEHRLCRRSPQYVSREGGDWCGEFSRVLSEELLATDLLMLQVSDRTRKICRALKVDNIADLLLLGRSAISYHGVPDKQAIRELIAALERLGISW